MTSRFLIALSLLLTTSLSTAETLTIEDAWVRFIPGNRPMAGYFILRNSGEAQRTLVGAYSPAFSMTHLHRSLEKDGVSTMEPVEEIVIPAGERLEFRPGGYHLMLMQPVGGRPGVGDEVKIFLEFADGERVGIPFAVKPSWQE